MNDLQNLPLSLGQLLLANILRIGLRMTTLQEAAMRKALEALESLQRYDGTLTGAQVAAAIKSLRTALAQQGEQPVAWMHACNALCVDELELWIAACPHCGKPRSTGAPPAPQPAQGA